MLAPLPGLEPVLLPVTPPLVTGLAPITPGAVPIQANDIRAPPIIITPSILLSQGYTDNPRSTPMTFSDAVTHLSGGTAISFDTVRLQGQLNGTLDFQKFARASDEDTLNANLLAFGLGTIVRDHLFIDGRAAFTPISQTGTFGFASPSLIPTSQQTQALSLSFTPIARGSIDDLVDGEFRYNYSISRFLNGGLLSNSSSVNAFGNSPLTSTANTDQNEATLTLTTGRRFPADFSSKLTFDAMKINSASVADSNQLQVFDDVSYQVNRRLAATARLGYEDLQYPLSPVSNVKGMIWRIGAQWRPFPDTYLDINYGQQQGITGLSGDFRYKVTASTSITGSLHHNRTTSAQQFLTNLNTTQLNANGILVNQTTGIPTTLVNLEVPFTPNAVFDDEIASLGAQNVIGRNTFGLYAFFDHRTPTGVLAGVTGVAAALSGSDTSLGANLSWNHSLRPDLTSSAALGFATEAIGHTKTVTADWLLSYTLSAKLTATLRYQFINVNSNLANTTYYRNQIEIGVRRYF